MSDQPTQPTRNPGFDGMDARRRGEPVEACPYEPGPQRTAWVVGWYIASSTDPSAPVFTGPDEGFMLPSREQVAQALCMADCAGRGFSACTWDGISCADYRSKVFIDEAERSLAMKVAAHTRPEATNNAR